MVESTVTAECYGETNVHLTVQELRCLQYVDIVVTEPLEGVTGRELELHQVSTC
jgi:hypothetical protein